MTGEQLKLLSELNLYRRHHGFPPTMAELQVILGYNSKGSVMYHVDRLVESGHLKRITQRHRSIELTKKGQNALWNT